MKIVAWPTFRNKTCNPYNYLLYTHMKQFGAEIVEFSPREFLSDRFAIWHVHWPESVLNTPNPIHAFAKMTGLITLIKLAKARGTCIIWTVHNLGSHEKFYPGLEKLFWRIFTSYVDGYISLSKVGVSMALERFPMLRRVPGVVIPHGDYREVYPNVISRQEARRRLGLQEQAKVLLFFGQIRQYKNIPYLIRTFKQLSNPQLVLLVAGRPSSEGLKKDVLKEASEDARVRLYLEFVADEDVQVFMNAADLVVLPYREILNSGSALLALSFGRPVLVPEKGAVSELKVGVGEEWVYTYQGELTPQVLAYVLERIGIPRDAPALEKFNWNNIARMTLEFYETVLNNKIEKRKCRMWNW